MHLLVISLLTLLAGTLLLAKVRKDMPGKFFAFMAWFFIAVGFLLFAASISMGICRWSNCGNTCKPGVRHEMMMKQYRPGMPGMRGGGPCCPPGMGRHMCPGKPGCLPADSTMKCCPKHKMVCDTVKARDIRK